MTSWKFKSVKCDFEVLIVFKLPELPLSCSKRIINIFQLSQWMTELPMESL